MAIPLLIGRRMAKVGISHCFDMDRLGHAGVKVKWEPVEARQIKLSEPSLALGFFVSAPPQRMPAAPRAFYSPVAPHRVVRDYEDA